MGSLSELKRRCEHYNNCRNKCKGLCVRCAYFENCCDDLNCRHSAKNIKADEIKKASAKPIAQKGNKLC